MILFVLFIDFSENVLETAVVFLEYRILGTQIKRIATLQSVLERRMGEIANRFVSIVHGLGDASTFKIIDSVNNRFRAVIGHPFDFQLASTRD